MRIWVEIDEELLCWARDRAYDQNISFSELITQIIEREKQAQYWEAYEQWKALDLDLRIKLDASQRLLREEIYKR